MSPKRRPAPTRTPGAPFATTVLMVELLPGTRAYADTYRIAPPLLVIDTGPTEIHLALPGDRPCLDDLHILDDVLQAVAKYRASLLVHLD